jgi:hypothetical protein
MKKYRKINGKSWKKKDISFLCKIKKLAILKM